jgi:hypothetical protein
MSSRSLAWTSVVLGALAVLSIPVGVLLPGRALSVDLVPSTIAGVVAAFVFGLAGVSAARRARLKIELSVRRTGDRQARYGRVLVLVGLYLGTVGAIALVFYGVVLSIS